MKVDRKEIIFLLLLIMIYLSMVSPVLFGDENYKLTGNVFSKNKIFDYLINFIYLDKIHSRLILQQGLPVVRVKPDELTRQNNNFSPAVNFTCEFMTDLPPSFFRLDSKREIKEVTSRFRGQLDQQTKKKIRAEGTHENEDKRRVKLDFWQTETGSDHQSTVKPDPREQLKPPQKESLSDRLDSEGALVGIYHSHTSENYGNKGYQSHAEAGEKGDVVKVGDYLANYLQKEYGIETAHSPRVHDETYSQSYLESLQTSQRVVQDNPNLKMMFDIHRDAIGEAEEDLITTTINGQRVARIMIVVTGNDYLSNPHWRKNLTFAKRLAKKMEQMYPGLLRRVEMINNRRYNLHVHQRALLLEVGGAKNSLQEAKRSIRLLGNVIAELMQSEFE